MSSAVSGGNGNGVIDANECNDMSVNLMVSGCATARHVSASLSTTTPGVTITQPNSPYPDAQVGHTATNTVPFSVSTGPGFVCGTLISFTLTVTFDGGSNVLSFSSLPTCVQTPVIIMGSLGPGDLQQTPRVGRLLPGSACGTPKAYPGPLGAGLHFYDIYSFVNGGAPACVRVDMSTDCPATTNPIFTVAYLGSFDPNNIGTNYLGDSGDSPNPSNSFSVDVPANATLLINVQDILDTAPGCPGYRLTVSGLIGNAAGNGVCQPCTITCPGNVTTNNEPGQCGAVVTYPPAVATGTCGEVTYSLPSGSFFPTGTTIVTASTTSGASCTFNVTVNDTEAPAIKCPANVTVNEDPSGKGTVVNYPAPTVTDNCAATAIVTCVPPSGSVFPVGTTTVTCTAQDAGGPGSATCQFDVTVLPGLSIDDVTVEEGNTGTSDAVFTVTLSSAPKGTNGNTNSVTVNFATADGTATAPSDYTATSGTLTFAAGETSKEIRVPVKGDRRFEPDETFYVNLSDPTNAGIAKGQGICTIVNDDAPPSQPLNLSTRMRVSTGDRVGIGGFIVTGPVSKHLLIRAIGPTLARFGLPDLLADPVLELHGPSGFTTVVNNNWRDMQEGAIRMTGLAPTDDRESAIDVTLAPGPYTAVVKGNNNTSGVALVEVYDLSPNGVSSTPTPPPTPTPSATPTSERDADSVGNANADTVHRARRQHRRRHQRRRRRHRRRRRRLGALASPRTSME